VGKCELVIHQVAETVYFCDAGQIVLEDVTLSSADADNFWF